MRVEIADDRPRVEVPLSDGTVALLSPLLPDDRPYMVEGLDEMSLESRFDRFGQGLRTLTEREWKYLSEVDQHHHVAWAAAVDGQGAGIGRYIRFADDHCAEVAVTVLDDYQHRGLGTALFLALVAVARADGVTAFCFEVVATNNRVREVLKLLGAEVIEDAGSVEGKVNLTDRFAVPREQEFLAAMTAVRSDS